MVMIGIIQKFGVLLLVSARLAFMPLADPYGDMVNSLGAGSSQGIISHMGSSITITIADQTGTYNKAQAADLLNAFFRSHPAVSFTPVHRGGNESQFGIGTLVTRNGSFRVTFFLHSNGNILQLQELRFQDE
jgi:hypothetical protein